MEELAEFKLHWIEEPTSPDDVMGHLKVSQALKKYGTVNLHCRKSRRQWLVVLTLVEAQVPTNPLVILRV